MTSLNPTSGASNGHGLPFPLANSAKDAPSKTKKLVGAKASHADDNEAIHVIASEPIEKPSEYSNGVALIQRVVSAEMVEELRGI